MELSTAWLEWLVLGTGRELMLFASVGILLIGIDDLLLDLLWVARGGRASLKSAPDDAPPAGRFAVFVPAWREEAVLARTIERTLDAWRGEDFRIYVGCYPNDVATLFSVSPLAARDPRLRLVVGEGDGPTTKGDNLNRLWAALGDDERAEGMRYAAVVLHDAEDHVHPGELALYRRHLAGHAMVQIPVVPLIRCGSRWVGGHYGDEFAEAHGKELPLRSQLGLGVPSAGVGCALRRSAVALLAIERGGQPFRPESLTEDYEMGMLIAAYGLSACFIDTALPSGERIVSRGGFPGTIDGAVRQKSRWITGIALAGWDHLGWPDARREVPPAAMQTWLGRWMLWRDRRAPLAAIIMLAAYVALIVTGIGWAGMATLGWKAPAVGDGLRLLLAANAALLVWRLAMRAHFTARWYGWREGVFAVPRAFVANIVAILAARRAVLLYWRMLRSGEVVWDKTEHRETDGVAVPLAVRTPAR